MHLSLIFLVVELGGNNYISLKELLVYVEFCIDFFLVPWLFKEGLIRMSFITSIFNTLIGWLAFL